MRRLYTVEERQSPRGSHYVLEDGKAVETRTEVGQLVQKLIDEGKMSDDNGLVRIVRYAKPTEVASWARFEQRPAVTLRREVMAFSS